MDYSSAELRQQGMTLQRFVVGYSLFTSDLWPNLRRLLQIKLDLNQKPQNKAMAKTLNQAMGAS